MKWTLLLPAIIFNLSLAINSSAQQSDERIIRGLEEAEREALLKGDTAKLSSLMSREIVVLNPENVVVNFRQIMDRIKTGKINYSTFERKISHIAFVNNIAIVMGLETLIPQGDTKNAGKTVKRSFTNIWTQENGTWKLTARQVTIASIE